MLSEFESGASCLMSRQSYAYYVEGKAQIGRWNDQMNRGELFVIPKSQMDYLLATYPNDPRKWEEALGLETYSLGSFPVRVDINDPEKYGLRQPDTFEKGYTGRGTPGIPGSVPPLDEAVIGQVPNPEKFPEVGKISRVERWVERTEVTEETSVRESMGPDGTVELETETTTTVSQETTVTIEEKTNSNENHLDDGMEI